MDNVRKLISVLKSGSEDPPGLFAHGYQDAIRRLSGIKTSKFGNQLPVSIKDILLPVDLLVEDLKKIERNHHNSVELLNSAK